jgi:chemotaxis signal transduction protein/DNA-binding transcriptional ArsR family regulator
LALRPPFRLPAAHADDDVLAKVFRGLGDPTRLRLLAALGDGSRTVGQLVDELDVPQPRVSSHLAALRWCGFVTSRREHRSVHYRLADPRVLQLVAAAQGVVADHRRSAAGTAIPVAAGSAPPAAPAPTPAPDTPARAAAPGLHVIFELGEEACALPVRQVREVMRHEPPRRVPSTLPGLLGVRDVRGALLGVHDLATVLGHPAGEPTSLLVVHDHAGRVSGLAVGAIHGVEPIEPGTLHAPPTDAPGVAALATGRRGLVLVLDADGLLETVRGPASRRP